MMLLAVANAGPRLIAVGEHGVVALSDDNGKSFRQAKSVPVSGTLTSVEFVDALHGWAAGHEGAIIATEDGGETWALQRLDTKVDQPLFSIHFTSASEGWACGLWSLLLHTEDGGKTWSAVDVPSTDDEERNLSHIFGGKDGSIYIAAEQGSVLRSKDGGKSWVWTQTGYQGSFWTGQIAADGTVIVGGLRGNIFRSRDGGDTWQQVNSPAKGSITDIVVDGGNFTAVALDGWVITGQTSALHSDARQRTERDSLTGVRLLPRGALLLTSTSGVLVEEGNGGKR